MEDWQARIEICDEIMGGKPVIKDTRVPIQVLLGALAAGDSIEAVQESYGVSRDDVLAALAYAAPNVALEVVHALPGG